MVVYSLVVVVYSFVIAVYAFLVTVYTLVVVIYSFVIAVCTLVVAVIHSFVLVFVYTLLLAGACVRVGDFFSPSESVAGFQFGFTAVCSSWRRVLVRLLLQLPSQW